MWVAETWRVIYLYLALEVEPAGEAKFRKLHKIPANASSRNKISIHPNIITDAYAKAFRQIIIIEQVQHVGQLSLQDPTDFKTMECLSSSHTSQPFRISLRNLTLATSL